MNEETRRNLMLLIRNCASAQKWQCADGGCALGESCDMLDLIESNAEGFLLALTRERAEAAAATGLMPDSDEWRWLV